MFRKGKIHKIEKCLAYHWGILYEFYPSMSDIKDISVFKDFLYSGHIKHMWRTAVIGSKVYECQG